MQEIEFGSAALFEFQSIVDLDLALLKYIQVEFSNSKFFNKIVVQEADDYILKSLLVSRTNINPLSVIIDDKYMSSINGLYDDLILNKENEILKFGTPLATYNIFHIVQNSESGIKCVVNCRNVHEEQFIKNIKEDIPIITDGYNVDLSKYKAFYIKNVEDALKYKTFNGKSIYFLDYEYNIEPNRKERLPIIKIGSALSFTNDLYFIDPYKNFVLPV